MKTSTPKFQRTKEDFVCQHCGEEVAGTGYTNHCPKCLWSKHVDINPGDRAEICQGMMQPVGAEVSGGDYIIIQRCKDCRHEKRNKAGKDDNFEVLLELSTRTVKPRPHS